MNTPANSRAKSTDDKTRANGIKEISEMYEQSQGTSQYPWKTLYALQQAITANALQAMEKLGGAAACEV